jgi:6-phosphofructokinase 1
MPSATGRLLITQSGGPTAVINQTLAGIVEAARASGAFSGIIGAHHGAQGLLDASFVDLGRQSPGTMRAVAKTTGAALGTSRHKISANDIDKILQTFFDYKITAFIGIGGNDSAENALTLEKAAKAKGQALTVVVAPKTVDNDLLETDHCPGYGSAARFIALATMGDALDAEAMGKDRPVTVIEAMGRNSGWLPAAAILGKRDERDAPHIVCIPEIPLIEDDFIAAVEGAITKHGYAIAVVSENVRGPKGPLGESGEPEYVDEFGHPYYPSTSKYLARLAGKRLKVRTRFDLPGTIQRAFAECVSPVDAREAYAAGRAAARCAAKGEGGVMVTLTRASWRPYRCVTGVTRLENVAAKERLLPEEFFDKARGLPTAKFVRYAMPLIGGALPEPGRLKALAVKR